jgi:hypothetical protein
MAGGEVADEEGKGEGVEGFTDEEEGAEDEHEEAVVHTMTLCREGEGMNRSDVLVGELEDVLDELGGEGWRHLCSAMRGRGSAGVVDVKMSY